MPLCLNCFYALSFSHEQLNKDSDTSYFFNEHPQFAGGASLLNFTYGNVVQKLIHANKYYNQPHIGAFIATLAQPILKDLKVDVVSCVPTHPKTLRQRGYNQVDLFARTVALSLEATYKPHLLRRVIRKDSQVHRNKQQRIASLANAFEVAEDSSPYRSILLVDDVMTTGSTLNVCLNALEKNTEASIYLFTMARVV